MYDNTSCDDTCAASAWNSGQGGQVLKMTSSLRVGEKDPTVSTSAKNGLLCQQSTFKCIFNMSFQQYFAVLMAWK